MTNSTSCIIGVNHIGLSVADLNDTVAFYKQSIDVTAEPNPEGPNRDAEKASGFEQDAIARATLKGPNVYLRLSQYPDPEPAEIVPVKGPGITHVCYQSLKTDDIFGRLLSNGATPITRGGVPISLLGQGIEYAYARDPEGLMVEVEHLERAPFKEPVWIAHVAYASHDLDRLADFYELLLGKPPARRSDNVKGSTFDVVADYDDVHIRAAWFDVSNFTLEFWQFVNPPTPESGAPKPYESIGYNKVAFDVSDIQSEYERLMAAGVEFLSAPVKSEESTEVFGRDPDGNLFSLIEPASESSISIKNLAKKDW